MSAGAIRAGKAFVEILAEDSQARRVLKRFQADMQSWATTMNNLGRAMLLPAIGLGLALGKTVRSFADFEAQMSRVKARIGKSDEGFAALQKRAIELGKSTVFSASQVAQAMAELAQAGNNSAQILAKLPAVLNFAAAAEIELAEASLFATTTLNVFKLGAEQLEHVTDIIVKAANNSETSVQQMAEAFSYAAPSFANVGGTVQELAGTLSLLAHAGQVGDRAGTAIRGIFAALEDPSEKGHTVIKQMIGDVNDAKGNFIGITAVVERLQQSLAGAGGGAKLAAISKIFDNRMASAITALVNSKPGELAAEIRDVFNSQGTAAEFARIQMDNLRGDFKKLMGTLDAFQITITSAVVEPLRKFVTGLRTVVSLVDEWAKANPEIVRTTLAFASAFIVAAPTLVATSIALKLAAFAFQPLFVGMTLLRIGILQTAAAFGFLWKVLGAKVALKALAVLLRQNLAGALILIKMGISGLIASIATGFMFLINNPVALLGLALVGIGAYALYASGLWGKAVAAMKSTWKNFTEDGKRSWDALTTAVQAGRMDLAFKVVTIAMELAWMDAVDGMRTVWEDFATFFEDVWDQATTNAAIGAVRLGNSISDAAAAITKSVFGIDVKPAAPGKAAPAGQFSVPPEQVARKTAAGHAVDVLNSALGVRSPEQDAISERAKGLAEDVRLAEQARPQRASRGFNPGFFNGPRLRQFNNQRAAEHDKKRAAQDESLNAWRDKMAADRERIKPLPIRDGVPSAEFKRDMMVQESDEKRFQNERDLNEGVRKHGEQVLADRKNRPRDDGSGFVQQVYADRERSQTQEPVASRFKKTPEQLAADQAAKEKRRADQVAAREQFQALREARIARVKAGPGARSMLASVAAEKVKPLMTGPQWLPPEMRAEQLAQAQAKIDAGSSVSPDDAEGVLTSNFKKRRQARRLAQEEARENRRKQREGKLGELDFTRKKAEEALKKSGKGEQVGGGMGGGTPGMGDLGKTSVVGSFSAEVAKGLSGGDTHGARIANATEKTAKGIEDLNKKKPPGFAK